MIDLPFTVKSSRHSAHRARAGESRVTFETMAAAEQNLTELKGAWSTLFTDLGELHMHMCMDVQTSKWSIFIQRLCLWLVQPSLCALIVHTPGAARVAQRRLQLVAIACDWVAACRTFLILTSAGLRIVDEYQPHGWSSTPGGDGGSHTRR